ncbi:MAG: hypothetical protein QM796_03095 [Chthoniobacteraceae bacterium]
MNKGMIALGALSTGLVLIIGLFYNAAAGSDWSQFVNANVATLSLSAISLWMGGSFLLAAHLKLPIAWGLAGVFSVLGIGVMLLLGEEHRREEMGTDELASPDDKARSVYDY